MFSLLNSINTWKPLKATAQHRNVLTSLSFPGFAKLFKVFAPYSFVSRISQSEWSRQNYKHSGPLHPSSDWAAPILPPRSMSKSQMEGQAPILRPAFPAAAGSRELWWDTQAHPQSGLAAGMEN